MYKNCLNCSNLDQSNYLFTSCKKCNEYTFEKYINETMKEDDEADISCSHWEDD